MPDLNLVLIEGCLTADPFVGSSPKATPTCTFVVTCRHRIPTSTDKQAHRSSFTVEVPGTRSQACHEHLHAGTRVRIVGFLMGESSLNSQGEEQPSFKVVAEHVEFRPDRPQA